MSNPPGQFAINDTHPDAERVQIELLRKATGAQRFNVARTLTATTRRLAWRAIKRSNTQATDDEVDLLFVAHYYGQDLADNLRAYLEARK